MIEGVTRKKSYKHKKQGIHKNLLREKTSKIDYLKIIDEVLKFKVKF
jgi:hypothetical protein